MKHRHFKRCLAQISVWIWGGTVVFLRANSAEVYIAVARQTPFGDTMAYYLWPHAIGPLILAKDGKCTRADGGYAWGEWVPAPPVSF